MTETTTPRAGLPEDTHLAYTDWREAWYADPKEKPKVGVAASAKGSGGGVAWEFQIEEHDFGSQHGKAVRLGIFDDAFAAFGQIPEFFARLAAGIDSLDGVIALLEEMGAVDETGRESPYRDTRQRTPSARVARAVADAAIASYEETDGKVLEIYEAAIVKAVESALETYPLPVAE